MRTVDYTLEQKLSDNDSQSQLLSQALGCHQAGDAAEAEQLYRRVLKENPLNVDALHLLGMLVHERNEHPQSLALIAAAIEVRPDLAALHNSLGVVQMASGDPDAAAVSFQESIRLSPELADAHRNLGLARRRLGQSVDAETCYREAVRLDPNNARSQLGWGELSLEREDWWTAESCFRQVLQMSPSPEIHTTTVLALANLLNLQERANEVIELLAPLMQRGSENGCPSIQLAAAIQFGVAHGKLGQHEQAAESLLEAVALDPESAEACFNLSLSLLAMERNQDSFKFANMAVQHGAAEHHRLHMATVLERLDRLDEAAEVLSQLRQDDPKNVRLLEMIADLELRRGNETLAIETYQQVLNVDPTRGRALYALASLCEQSGQIDCTVETCVTILKQDPNSVTAHLLLGLVLASRLAPEHRAKMDLDERDQLTERAVKHLRHAATLDPSAETFDAWGRVLIHTGQHAEAVEKLNQSVALKDSFTPAHENLGRAYLELGDLEQAKKNFRTAVSIQPMSCDAHYELARLESKDGAKKAVGELRRLLGRDGLSSHQRMTLRFALARRLDSLGDFESAFENYVLANQEKSQQPPRDGDDGSWEQITERMIRVFDGDSGSRQDSLRGGSSGCESRLPVFIVGMPRSGTTLVEQILSSHANVFGAGELASVSDLANSIARRTGSKKPFPESVVEMDDDLASALAQEYLSSLERKLPRRDEGANILRVTDKMPTNFRFLGLIAKWFPKAHVIYVRRDPRDIFVSCFKQNLAWPFCDFEAVADYYRQHLRLMEHWRTVLDLPIHEIWYEALIRDQEGESRRLVEFCDLPWDENCLEFANAERAVQTPSKWQVRQPLYETSVGAWKRYERQLGRDFAAEAGKK